MVAAVESLPQIPIKFNIPSIKPRLPKQRGRSRSRSKGRHISAPPVNYQGHVDSVELIQRKVEVPSNGSDIVKGSEPQRL